MADLPEPLVGSHIELRDFPFMPLEVGRLRRSKAWLLAKRTPELGFYMLNLWCASWHESPPASIEDDDDVLADLAMCDPKKWGKIRNTVLHGWVKCSDGRLYHPVVAEKAIEAWERKKAQRQKTEAARAAREAKRLHSLSGHTTGSVTENVTADVTDPHTEPETENVTQSVAAAHSPVTGSKGQGQGQGQGNNSVEGGRPPPNGSDRATDDFELFRRGREILGENAGGMVAKLKTHHRGNIALARASIETASTKHDPREYVARIIAGPGPLRPEDMYDRGL